MHSTRVTKLTGPVADAMLNLVFGHEAIPKLSLPTVARGDWGGFGFEGYDSRLTLAGATLHLHCKALGVADPFSDFARFEEELNLPSSFVLADQSTLDVRITNVRKRGGLNSPVDIGVGALAHLDHWTWTTGLRPTVWLGSLAGADFHRGNLSLTTRSTGVLPTGYCNLRLEGQCNWHLLHVPGEEETVVVVEAPPTGLTPELLRLDFKAAEYSLGHPLALDAIVGIDEAFRPVAAMGLRFGARRLRSGRCPVPERLDSPVHWPAELFRHVALKLADGENEQLLVPLGAYLDGATAHLDLAYLAAQVGLEAFSSRLAGSSAPTSLVTDLEAWQVWVAAQSNAIQKFARDAVAARKLLGKVIGAQRVPTGDVVEAALARFGLAVPDEVLQEIGKRSRSVHQYLMADVHHADLQADVVRRNMVLTLLAALIAQYVGFQGPIAGWVRDEYGHPLTPEWWPHAGSDAEAVVYSCERMIS